MQVDLNTLVTHANTALRDQLGFISCSIESSSERLLAYQFADTISAHAFQGERCSLGMTANIPNDRQTTVIVKHD